MKSDKRHLTNWMELPNQDKIRTLAENETYKYLRILVKDKIQIEYITRTRKILEKKLSDRTMWKKT